MDLRGIFDPLRVVFLIAVWPTVTLRIGLIVAGGVEVISCGFDADSGVQVREDVG
jgi:hypothetical protein